MNDVRPEDAAAVPAFVIKPGVMLILQIIFLCLLGILIYSNTFHSPFHFDDEYSIVKNHKIQDIHDIGAIWDYWPLRFVTDLSLAANYHLGGLDVSGYHLVNILIHVGSSLFVMWFCQLIFSAPAMKDNKMAPHKNAISFLVALIFISHPIQVQGVTYIVQRAASMMAFFYMAVLCLYLKSRLKGSAGVRLCCYFGALAAAVMAMFTKETAITLPAAVLLCEIFFLKEPGRKIDLKYALPIMATAAALPLTAFLTKSVNLASGAMPAIEDKTLISSSGYLLTQFRVLVTYIRLLIFPVNQQIDYAYPVAKSLTELPVFASMAFLLAILAAAFKLFKKARLVSFGIFWFFITLLPESSIWPLKDVIFEHRLYLPMVGYGLFLVSACYYIFGKNNFKAMVIVFSVLVACYSAATYTRNFVWRSKFSLWDDSVRKAPNKGRPYNDRGNAYLDEGSYDMAIDDFSAAVTLDPSDFKAYNNRAIAHLKKGEYDKALSDCNRALDLRPNLADLHNNRGNVYRERGDIDKAISDYSRAIEIDPKFADAYNNRGIALGMAGDPDKAIDDLNRAIEIDPKFADAYNNRGIAYSIKKDYDRAIADYNRSLELKPGYANAFYDRGLAYHDKKEYRRAWEDIGRGRALGYNADTVFLEKLKESEQSTGHP